jgi:hypothetical protein
MPRLDARSPARRPIGVREAMPPVGRVDAEPVIRQSQALDSKAFISDSQEPEPAR